MQRILEIPEHAASLHMHHVILWTNGICMVFSDNGEQMPYYQGMFEVRAQRINNVFCGQWEYGDWNKGILSGVPL